jgi:alkylhydroperoxidase/carboxymuconolactone decarboxylase family protein YurZ
LTRQANPRTRNCREIIADVLVEAGCTRAELEEMLGMCVYMGGGPSLIYAAHALQAYEQFGGASTRESRTFTLPRTGAGH